MNVYRDFMYEPKSYQAQRQAEIDAINAALEEYNRGKPGTTYVGTGLKSTAYPDNPYQNYSRALGMNYNVDEYIPLYHRNYNDSAPDQAQLAADRAEAENVRRYYEILSGYRSMLDNGQASVASAYDKAATMGLQNMVNRGLTGTTVLNNFQTQNAVNKANALQNNYNQNLGNMLQYMERRNTGTGKLI